MHRSNNGFDLNALKIFQRVIELSSLSKAAEELAINASTVSRKITELEMYYGVKLLHRTTRVLTLTAEGRSFYGYCQGVEALLQRSENEIMNNQIEPTGVLKIVAPVDLGNLILLGPITQFAKTFPKVKLDLDFSNRFVNVNEEGVDIWFNIGDDINQSLIARQVVHYKRYLMASQEYLAEYGKIDCLDDIKAPHRTIKSKNAFNYHHSKKDLLNKLPISLSINSSYAACQACIAGLGLAFITPTLAKKVDIESNLVTILKEDIYQETTINMVYKEQKLKPMRTEVFINHMTKFFEGETVSTLKK
ncbi:LysR family transcriptional regulator [Vibrio sp. McD22-P3]|uniref:LysR family transcriptional regulator n=1 Tax=Vibrio sp. McD22-P3 TaxID=2724880 RepID=UPI001F1C3D3A|nr:LysR family transcriptional regulator [Vibrio sp. McD22-P3]MCF4176857.1 LysR family transcriptional regulator [Vibrio sp. McD22-P3]